MHRLSMNVVNELQVINGDDFATYTWEGRLLPRVNAPVGKSDYVSIIKAEDVV